MAITLATIRARIRTQMESAWGFPDPLAVDTSTETLTTLRDRVETFLQDSANTTWTTTSIDEAIEKALEEYNRHTPALALTTITLGADGREVDISGVSDLLRVIKVWTPYDSAAPDWPPNWVQFDTYPGQILFIDETTEPASGDKVRIWYTTPATLNGLAGASATTIPTDDITYIINGAAYYAAQQYAVHQLHAPTDLQLPNALTVSSATLATLRDRVETLLQDSTNATWATADIDEAIEKAVEEYNNVSPQLLIHDHTVSTAGREQTLVITGLRDIKAVWFPYTSGTLEYPPKFVGWKIYPAKVLYVDAPTAPAVSDHIRVWHTKDHTLNGLNAAGSTTIPVEHVTYLINGAAAYCARERTIEISEDVTVDDDTITHIKDWGDEQYKTFTANLAALANDPTKPDPEVAQKLMNWSDNQGKAFRYGMRKNAPSWQRHAYAYQNDDIDEAIRWALGTFNEIAPQETVDTITLAADGREIALTTLTDLLRVTRIWWPYDSSSPQFPPNWVRYEVWGNGPTGTLFIDDNTEPSSGDAVRVWYERLSALKDLDGAAATTLPDDAETLLVTGATGYLSKERIMEEPTSRWRVPRALREWAESQLKDFAKSLTAYSRRQATGAAGLGHLPPMDKWESQDDDKW